MKRLMIFVAAFLLVLPLHIQTGHALATAQRAAAAGRKQCCHGCKSKYCSRTNCGTTCKQGPKCQGCWKDTCIATSSQTQPQLFSGTCPSPDHYINTAGQCVHRPIQSQTVPQGATAQCRDGTYSFSHFRRGTCSHHSGVARWL
jgi:uncharacterized protein DUF3761